MSHVVEIFPNRKSFHRRPFSHYSGWSPRDTKSHGIINREIYLVLSDYLGHETRRVKINDLRHHQGWSSTPIKSDVFVYWISLWTHLADVVLFSITIIGMKSALWSELRKSIPPPSYWHQCKLVFLWIVFITVENGKIISMTNAVSFTGLHVVLQQFYGSSCKMRPQATPGP